MNEDDVSTRRTYVNAPLVKANSGVISIPFASIAFSISNTERIDVENRNIIASARWVPIATM